MQTNFWFRVTLLSLALVSPTPEVAFPGASAFLTGNDAVDDVAADDAADGADHATDHVINAILDALEKMLDFYAT